MTEIHDKITIEYYQNKTILHFDDDESKEIIFGDVYSVYTNVPKTNQIARGYLEVVVEGTDEPLYEGNGGIFGTYKAKEVDMKVIN